MSCANLKLKIMEEKKPKRPRIGALPTTSENTENKDQYFQSRPYKGTERPEFGQRGFQPRPRTYQNSYTNSYRSSGSEEGGYSRQTRPAYQQRANSYNRGYQNGSNTGEGYKRYSASTSSDSENQNGSSENTYQQTQPEGGYQQPRQHH